MPADAFAQKQAMMHRLQEQQEAFKVLIKCSTQQSSSTTPVLLGPSHGSKMTPAYCGTASDQGMVSVAGAHGRAAA